MDAVQINEMDPNVFDKALVIKKRSNIIICIFIILFGISSIYYTIPYEGSLLIAYRDLAVNGTTFSILAAFWVIIVNIWESVTRKEIVCESMYYLRLSAAVTETVIFFIAVIEYIYDDYLPGEPFMLYRFDMAMMDVVIPALVIVSFCVNDTPIHLDQVWKEMYGAFLITMYGIVMTALILLEGIPESKIPFYCLNVRKTNIGLMIAYFVLTYTLCFLLSKLFIRLNKKTYWLSYNVRWMDFLSSQYWDEHRKMLNVLQFLLGISALWLIAGGLSAYVQQEGSLIERSVYLFLFVYGAILATTAVFLPVFQKVFQHHSLFRFFSILFGMIGALLLGFSLLIHIFAFFVPKATGNEVYVVVLGAPVVEDRASENLRARVETAEKWLEANPGTKAILTGGNGDRRTEAEVMHDLLIEAGIPEEQLIIENQATTTKENLQFSRERIKEAEIPPIAVITNEFHLFRVRHHARQAGITNLCYIPVRTPVSVRFGWFARETIAIIGYLFTGKLFLF